MRNERTRCGVRYAPHRATARPRDRVPDDDRRGERTKPTERPPSVRSIPRDVARRRVALSVPKHTHTHASPSTEIPSSHTHVYTLKTHTTRTMYIKYKTSPSNTITRIQPAVEKETASRPPRTDGRVEMYEQCICTNSTNHIKMSFPEKTYGSHRPTPACRVSIAGDPRSVKTTDR